MSTQKTHSHSSSSTDLQRQVSDGFGNELTMCDLTCNFWVGSWDSCSERTQNGPATLIFRWKYLRGLFTHRIISSRIILRITYHISYHVSYFVSYHLDFRKMVGSWFAETFFLSAKSWSLRDVAWTIYNRKSCCHGIQTKCEMCNSIWQCLKIVNSLWVNGKR
jgi:hypothetical protein